jgi:nucleotide-binding universal stress UspA family protein
MKTIAVLTDFSRRSVHAAMFALHLAKKIKADVLLFNAFEVPAYAINSMQIDGPFEDYDEIKNVTENKLISLSRELENEIKGKSIPGTYLPAITCRCEEGAIANNIADIEEDKNVVLIVLATHGADDISAFMMGNNCRQIIDAASVPLLIVPENCSIKNIEKFVFATDLIHNDIDYISSVAALAKQFSAEILIANINQNAPLNEEHENAVNSFKEEIVHKINYSRVYYRNIPKDNVKMGLDWLIENVKFDILVMVHRKDDLSDFFFKSSITKKIADHAYIPLMVYPYPVTSVPSF